MAKSPAITLTDHECAVMAAKLNADTVREQQKHIARLEKENAGLRGLVKPLLRHKKANKR